MVKNISQSTRSGMKEWLAQRVSAVIIAAYVIFLMAYFLTHSQISYLQWTALFSHNWMKVFTLAALLALMVHSWIGMWTVFTDYIKPPIIRLLLEIFVILTLGGCFFWGIILVWSL